MDNKALKERRNDLLDEMERCVNTAKAEKRNLTQKETRRFEEVKNEIAEIDEQLEAESREYKGEELIMTKDTQNIEQRKADEAAFLTFVKENRATGGMTSTGNGAVIPVSIAKRIVETARNISPIVSLATVWNVAGDLRLPSYDYTQNVFQYVTEGTPVTDSNGVFSAATLTNFIIGSLSKVSNSLINRSDVNVVEVIVQQIALSLANFLEGELINETGAKLRGLKSGVTNAVNGATTAVIDVAELVKLQMSVPQVFQGNAKYLMNPQTWSYLRSLKASTGQLLINGDDVGFSSDGGLLLFGKEVLLSDNMPVMAANARSIYYGDFSGIDLKVTAQMRMQVLIERYADSYETGIVCFQELDSVVGNPAKLAVYVSK